MAPFASALAAPGAGTTFSVSVSFTPSPNDPLLVTFTTTVVPGTPTGFNWSFGDGQYWNGSGPGFASPVHHYPRGGTFPLAVTVWEGASAVTTTLSVTVVPAPLAAVAHATELAAPRTVLLSVAITGGTGTYQSIVWQFGDGHTGSGLSVEYTYPRAGRFVATVNVTDSQGATATSAVGVNASGPSPLVNGTVLNAADWVLLGTGAGLGAVAAGLAGFVIARRPAHRMAAAVAPNAEVDGPAPPAAAAEEARGPPSSSQAAVEVAAVEPRPAPPSLTGGGRLPGLGPQVPDSSAPKEALRISQRIVLHLAAQGSLGPDEVAEIGFTQAGISRSLGIRQNALTNVLRRLLAAEVLSQDVRHVRGQPRRLKVYRLTSRGEALARDLRRGQAPGRRRSDRDD